MAELFDIFAQSDTEVNDVDITTTHPDWTPLITLSGNKAAGRYKLIFSLQFQVGSTRNSFIYQFSLDGGNNWGPEYYKEVKDKTNTEIIDAFNLVDHPGGLLDVRVRVTRESNMNCKVIKGLISAERVR